MSGDEKRIVIENAMMFITKYRSAFNDVLSKDHERSKAREEENKCINDTEEGLQQILDDMTGAV